MQPFVGSLCDEEKAQLVRLIDTFERFRQLLESCDYTQNQDEYFEIMSNLWSFRSNFLDERIIWLFERTDFYQKNWRFFVAHEKLCTRLLEGIKALSVISQTPFFKKGVTALASGDYGQESYRHINEELELVNSDRCRRLMMIGCGSYPETVLYLHDNVEGVDIVGFDESHEAIYLANKVLAARNRDRIEFRLLDRNFYDCSDVDVIYLANFILYKKEILDRIVETAPDHIQIIVRTPQLLGRVFFEDPFRDLNSRLVSVDETEFNEFFLQSSFLLRKFNFYF